MTLKKILAERKRRDSLGAKQSSVCTDNQVAVEEETPIWLRTPTNEFYALFDGCTDF